MLASFQLPILILIFLAPISLGALGRPKEGFWLAWALGLCFFPAWLTWRVSPTVEINTRTAIALGGGVASLAFPRSKPRSRWGIVDLVFLVCLIGMLISEVATGSAGMFAPVAIILGWAIPYLVGRRFFATADEIGRFAKLMAPIIALTTAAAVFETISRVNIYNYLFSRFLLYQEIRGEFSRMGMKRATFSVSLPISFGMLMVLVLPWSLMAARQPGGPRWRRLLPAINMGAAACSLSRGPIAMGLLAWAITIFCWRPRLRRLLGGWGSRGPSSSSSRSIRSSTRAPRSSATRPRVWSS